MKFMLLNEFKTVDGLEDTEKEFVVEFFEVACETSDVLKLEINGRGLYHFMQIFGRKVY